MTIDTAGTRDWSGAGDDTLPEMTPVRFEVSADLWERVLFSGWCLVTIGAFPYFGPLRYLLVLGFIGAGVLRHQEVIRFMRRFWFFFLYPAWAALSAMWSPVPGEAFRSGILLSLDIYILIYAAARFSPYQIVKSLFYACALVCLLVAPAIPSVNEHNIPEAFGEKNLFAGRMFFVVMSGLYIILTPRAMFLERALAMLVIPIAFYGIMMSGSATSLVFAVVGSPFLIMMGSVWQGVAKVKSLSLLIMAAGFAVLLSGVLAAATLFASGPVEGFLAMLGKDTTLTGRTELWSVAGDLIAERPFLGVGMGGFWRPSVGEAQSLLMQFYKAQDATFSFHNSYLDMIVHLGFVGFFLFVIGLVFVLFRIVTVWAKRQDLTSSFFLIMGLLVFMRSLTEPDLFMLFDTNKVILFLGGLSGLSYVYRLVPTSTLRGDRGRTGRGATRGSDLASYRPETG